MLNHALFLGIKRVRNQKQVRQDFRKTSALFWSYQRYASMLFDIPFFFLVFKGKNQNFQLNIYRSILNSSNGFDKIQLHSWKIILQTKPASSLFKIYLHDFFVSIKNFSLTYCVNVNTLSVLVTAIIWHRWKRLLRPGLK